MGEDIFGDLVRRHTELRHPPLCPEIRTRESLHLVPIWEDAERLLGHSVEPPYWAYTWAGSQAIARYLLDHPEVVRGKRALDLGCGNGLAALSAARAGAAHVIANDIDRWAVRMAEANAALNGLVIELETVDRLQAEPPVPPIDVVLAGDLFYAREMSARVEPWVREAARRGALVLVGDPGRAYLPAAGLQRLAEYEVPVPAEIESVTMRRPVVWEVKAEIERLPP